MVIVLSFLWSLFNVDFVVGSTSLLSPGLPSLAEISQLKSKSHGPNQLAAIRKRFSMNYLDLVEQPSPLKNKPKRHSAAAFDALASALYPLRSTAGAHRDAKRFSMNFLDTIGDSSDPQSWQNTMGSRQSGQVQRRQDHIQGFKRSGAGPMLGSSNDVIDTIDELMEDAMESEGPEAICKSAVLSRLIRIRNKLAMTSSEFGGKIAIHC